MKTILISTLAFISVICIAAEPTADDKELKPGKLSQIVQATASSMKKAKNYFDRIKELDKLDKAIEADAEKSTVEGIRYSNALAPIMKNRKELSDKQKCAKVKSEMDYYFTSGSGFKGKLTYYAKDSLQLLAAICADPTLAKTQFD